jgi:hypothetical protein
LAVFLVSDALRVIVIWGPVTGTHLGGLRGRALARTSRPTLGLSTMEILGLRVLGAPARSRVVWMPLLGPRSHGTRLPGWYTHTFGRPARLGSGDSSCRAAGVVHLRRRGAFMHTPRGKESFSMTSWVLTLVRTRLAARLR